MHDVLGQIGEAREDSHDNNILSLFQEAKIIKGLMSGGIKIHTDNEI